MLSSVLEVVGLVGLLLALFFLAGPWAVVGVFCAGLIVVGYVIGDE